MRSKLLADRIKADPTVLNSTIAELKHQIEVLNAAGAVHMVVQFERELKRLVKLAAKIG